MGKTYSDAPIDSHYLGAEAPQNRGRWTSGLTTTLSTSYHPPLRGLVADRHRHPCGRLRVARPIARGGRQGVPAVWLGAGIPREIELGSRRFGRDFRSDVLPIELELHPSNISIIHGCRRQRD